MVQRSPSSQGTTGEGTQIPCPSSPTKQISSPLQTRPSSHSSESSHSAAGTQPASGAHTSPSSQSAASYTYSQPTPSTHWSTEQPRLSSQSTGCTTQRPSTHRKSRHVEPVSPQSSAISHSTPESASGPASMGPASASPPASPTLPSPSTPPSGNVVTNSDRPQAERIALSARSVSREYENRSSI